MKKTSLAKKYEFWDESHKKSKSGVLIDKKVLVHCGAGNECTEDPTH